MDKFDMQNISNGTWHPRQKEHILMSQVIAWLKSEVIHFKMTSPFQIKVGIINYYPSNGTILIDGSPKKSSQSGFEAFKRLALDHKNALQPPG